MKEFDYTKWDNKPREMWVWNKDESKKKKLFVIFIDVNNIYGTPVISKNGVFYEHCAEIEEYSTSCIECSHSSDKSTNEWWINKCMEIQRKYDELLDYVNEQKKYTTCIRCTRVDILDRESDSDTQTKSTRRMTNYELAHWLWEGTQKGEFREFIEDTEYGNDELELIQSQLVYYPKDMNEVIPSSYRIRVNGGEWKEPLIEG